MTRDEYVNIWRTKERILDALRNLLEQATCLLVGYSMRDTHVNKLYDEIFRAQSAKMNKLNFSVTRGPVNRLTRDYWQSRGLNLIGLKQWVGLGPFFQSLCP
jgi:SIR2-like domain